MRAVIIGGSGQVGSYLIDALTGTAEVTATYYSHARPGLERLDLLDRLYCIDFLAQHRPTHVFVPAAASHVDWCQDHPDQCRSTNVRGVAHVCEAAQKIAAKVIFFSTDQVFGDSDIARSETDPVAPLNVYAQSKVQAEQVIRRALPNDHLILRTAWVYGIDRQGKNFVTTLRRRLSQSESVDVSDDQWGSPTYALDLAQAALALIHRGCHGTYHVVGPVWTSRYEFAREVCRVFELSFAGVRPTPTVALRQRAPRPLRCRLNTVKFRKVVCAPLRAPREGLTHLKAAEARHSLEVNRS